MNTTIYVFSGTGTSLAMATNICKCMACIQYCPSNAISFKGKSLNKQKYYHPDFPAKKMIEFNN